MAETLRDKSRRNWANDDNSNEQIQLGCLLRIADSTEKMALRHTELINDRDTYKRWNENAQKHNELLKRQLSAAKGQITKLKRKLADAKGGV